MSYEHYQFSVVKPVGEPDWIIWSTTEGLEHATEKAKTLLEEGETLVFTSKVVNPINITKVVDCSDEDDTSNCTHPEIYRDLNQCTWCDHDLTDEEMAAWEANNVR